MDIKTMGTLGIFVLCLTLGSACALANNPIDDPKANTLVDCGAEKVAIFADTTSKDSHFALGWTLRPNRTKVPVDWSIYKPDDRGAFYEKHPFQDDEGSMEKQGYLLVNGVLDLLAKKFTDLPIEDPHFPGRNHHGIVVTWSADRRGSRFAVVTNDTRFSTADLLLVHVAPKDTHVISLSPTADKAVADRMRKRDPKDYRNYVTTYELGPDAAVPTNKTPQPEFQKDAVTIRFYTGVPKSDVDSDSGSITFALPKGTILGITFDKK